MDGHQAQAQRSTSGPQFTTQPLDYPEDKTELLRAFEWMECEKILLFSSDYPHWTYDDPRWLVKHLPSTPAKP